ncbi:MAG TPA: DUF1015 domain-containing protein [Gaiellaceae bacterium]|jgi:uncharacterized protein (DUF1015 family)
MGLLKPFRALRYDPDAVGLDDVVAPPYDVVTPELRERLLAASPWNAVRLVRPESPGAAASDLAGWQADGVLVREKRPAVWILEEDFTGPDGVDRARRGIVARIPVEPYSEGRILPHERTFPAAKRVRLRLLRATRTKLSPILLLHEGDAPESPAGDPDLEARFDGTRSRLWRVDHAAAIDQAIASVRGTLVIADGHHRYETALRFHEEDGTEETGWVLATLVARDDPGLVVFPTHRLAASAPELNGSLRQTPLPGGAAEGLERLAELPRDHAAFVLLGADSAVLAEDEPRGDPLADLDTTAVDRLAPGRLAFTAQAEEAEAAVRSGRAGAAFLVRPPTVEQIEAVARAGETMPQKSTYFFPKLLSGLVFSPFDE